MEKNKVDWLVLLRSSKRKENEKLKPVYNPDMDMAVTGFQKQKGMKRYNEYCCKEYLLFSYSLPLIYYARYFPDGYICMIAWYMSLLLTENHYH